MFSTIAAALALALASPAPAPSVTTSASPSAPASPSACAALPRVAAIAVDPAARIDVSVDQVFAIALRATGGSGRHWRLDSVGTREIVGDERTFVIDDVAYQRATMHGRHPAFHSGGPRTEYWIFDALETGSTTLTFVYAPGGGAPLEPETFAVTVRGC